MESNRAQAAATRPTEAGQLLGALAKCRAAGRRMSGIKDWKFRTKLVAPFSLIVILTSVVMYAMFYRSFSDIRQDAVPELQSKQDAYVS